MLCVGSHVWPAIQRAEPLRLELAERRSEPASAASRGIAIDESPQLGHGTARIVQVILVKIDEGESHSEVVTARERRRAQTVELNRSGLRLAERAGEQRRTPERSLDTISVVSSPFGVGLGCSLKMAARDECLHRGVAPASPPQSHIGHELKEAVDDRLQDTGKETDHETVDGPQGSHQLQCSRLGAGQRKHQRDDGANESDSTHHQAHEAERFLGRTGGGVNRAAEWRGEAQAEKLGTTA